MKKELSEIDIEQIILMAWADTIPFETIELEYGLNSEQVQKLMRHKQSPRTYRRWRQRVAKRSGTSSKHRKLTHVSSTKQKF